MSRRPAPLLHQVRVQKASLSAVFGAVGAVAILSLAAMVPPPAAAQQAPTKLISHQELTAYKPQPFKCAEQVDIIVTSDNASSFRGERRALQRLVGGVRAALSFECKKAEDIVLHGIVGKNLVWRGLASGKNEWVLVDLPVDATPNPSPKQQASTAPMPEQAPSSNSGVGSGLTGGPITAVDRSLPELGLLKPSTEGLGVFQ